MPVARPELAMTYSTLAVMRLFAYDIHGTLELGARAIELAEHLGELRALTDALMTVGTAEVMAGSPGAETRLQRALELAVETGLEELVVRGRANLGLVALAVRDYELADRQLIAGIEYCDERDLGTWPLYIRGWRARSELEQGHWDAAGELATTVLEHPRVAAPFRITPLVVIGRRSPCPTRGPGRLGARHRGNPGSRPELPTDRRQQLQGVETVRDAAGRHVRRCEARTPADNQTVRNLFVIGPDKKIKLILIYPMTTGRNFDEVLRVIDSLQLTAKHKVSTPVNWKQGEDVIISGSVSNDEARELFGEWESPRPYIRIVPQPRAPEPVG
jgi:C-terminal domain of 1-Cys peroxiredoxin